LRLHHNIREFVFDSRHWGWVEFSGCGERGKTRIEPAHRHHSTVPSTMQGEKGRLYERFGNKTQQSPQTIATVAAHQAEEDANGNHALRFTWTYWFCHRAPGAKGGSVSDYADQTKQIASFASVRYIFVRSIWGCMRQ
jgi:hypothetical protein